MNIHSIIIHDSPKMEAKPTYQPTAERINKIRFVFHVSLIFKMKHWYLHQRGTNMGEPGKQYSK
jgi:hypothetical protein